MRSGGYTSPTLAVDILTVTDLVCMGCSALALAAYQVRVSRSSATPALAPHYIESVRARWVASVVEGQRDILAVQTLRNMLMAASFFASTAFFAAVGLLSFGMNVSDVPPVFERVNFFGSTDQTLFTTKLLLIALVLFGTFFNFALTLRYYNHLGLVLNVPPDTEDDLAARAGALLQRGGLHYSWGMRGYYAVIPMALWLFGPLWMALGTALVLPLLHRHDHLPT